MAMALMLGPINADAIDSGAANAGDVLTADGAGRAAWQAPSGGGGGPAAAVVRMRCTGTTLNLVVKTAAVETIAIDFSDLTTGELITALYNGEYVASGSWTFPDAGPRIITLSNATALTTLNCYGNALTALDVSGATALTTLNCYGNALTALDVSDLTALTTLNCSGNPLTALDVSGCSALAHLYCYANALGGAAVDAVLVALAAMTVQNGTCNLTNNAAPTATGLAAKAVLEGRGWTVNVDS